jgi:pyridoxal phosphate enzyme (YggS family)
MTGLMIEQRIRENFNRVRDRIAESARRSGRPVETIRMVAVTKRSPPEWIRPLVACGARDLGENYPQELWRKTEALADLGDSVRWHLIGHLQTNKVKKTLPMVRMSHSVDSLKLLQMLDESATSLPEPPAVCLQVNISAEMSKHGWNPDQVVMDLEGIVACRRIPIVGLMTMAALGTTPETARISFVALRELRDDLRRRTGLALDELSMGMSGDFEAAVEEGATWIRVGSALFEGVEP